LAYHADPAAIELVARGLADADRSVRVSACAATRRLGRGQIDCDPDAAQSVRQDAAAKLRALHNRTP
jgi:hypothetical protein